MRKTRTQPNCRRRSLRLPALDHSKLAVLNSLGWPGSRRVYVYALDQFIAWYCSEPRLAFNRIVVTRYRMHLEQTTELYLGCKQNLGHPVNDLFRLGNIDAATYVVLAGTAVLTVKPESAQPDKMSDDEGSGDQEGSDEGASARFHGDGHPSL